MRRIFLLLLLSGCVGMPPTPDVALENQEPQVLSVGYANFAKPSELFSPPAILKDYQGSLLSKGLLAASNKEEAKKVITAFNALHTRALFLTAEDFRLGVETIEALSKEAAFPLVNANIRTKDTGEAILVPVQEIKTNDVSVYVIGLSSPHSKNPLPDTIEILPIKEPLQEALDSIPSEGNRLVVLVSDLPPDEMENVRKEFPEIQIYFGGLKDGFSQNSPGTIYSCPTKGSISFLEITPRFPVTYLRNDEIAAHYRNLASHQSRQMEALKNQWGATKKGSKKAELKEKLVKAEEEAKHIQLMSLPMADNFSTYRHKTVRTSP